MNIFVSVMAGSGMQTHHTQHIVKRLTGLYTGPYFDTNISTNITTQLGTHAYLPCKVKQLGNKSVSWIRRRDAHILTVDRYTFIADERFQVSNTHRSLPSSHYKRQDCQQRITNLTDKLA